MQHVFYLIIVAILCLEASCSTYRDSMKTAEKRILSYDSIHRVHYDFFHFRQDSVNRMWYFLTNDTFTYHPDRGLLASSGWFWVQEKENVIRLDKISVDSSLLVQHYRKDTAQSLQDKVFHRGYIWIVILLLLVPFFILWLR